MLNEKNEIEEEGMQLVYAIGTLGYDFGTEARRDSIVQHSGNIGESEDWNPDKPEELLEHLKEHPWEAASIIWTLKQEETPIYAIKPSGPFGEKGYEKLREFLETGLDKKKPDDRVSIPGQITGLVKLYSGRTIPIIVPALRGMYSWSKSQLMRLVAINALAVEEKVSLSDIIAEQQSSVPVGAVPVEDKIKQHIEKYEVSVGNFLDRVYYELRNMGTEPKDRALNYAATQAHTLVNVFASEVVGNMALQGIEVEKSPMCRADSVCYDVKITFFDPQNQLAVAKRVYRFTVDVSDEVPVVIGDVRNWSVN